MNTGALGGGDGSSSAPGSVAKYSSRLGFRPSLAPNEIRPLLRLYEESLYYFKSRNEAAKAFVSFTPGTLADADPLPERAAWTVVANVLLNLDETLTK